MRHKFLFSLLFAVLFFFPFQKVEAGGTQSVTRGNPMPTIFWEVTGTVSPCNFSTSYPDAAGDGIRTEWNAFAAGANGSKSFTGRNVWANPGSYTFRCDILVGATLYSDTATLVVNDCTLPATWDPAAHVCVAAAAPASVTSLTATPNPIVAGNSSTLTWTTANAASCFASGGWTGWKSNTGGSEVVTPPITTTYTLECWNASGSSVGPTSVTITVTAPGAPVITSFTATPNFLPAGGGNTTLAWTVANATSCFASGGWTGWKSNTGGSEVVAVVTTTTYTLECWNASGTSSGQQSRIVTVAAAAPASVTSLTATPNPIVAGNSSTLTWTTANAASCFASGGWTGWKSNTGGSEVVTPPITTTYTLECWNASGSSAGPRNVTITVNIPSTLKICQNSCSSNIQVNTILMNDTDPARNVVACYSAALGCTDASANVTGATTWSESGPNAVTLSGINPKTVTPVLLAAPGTVTEQVSATYAGNTASFDASVTKFCASGCTAANAVAVCSGESYTVSSPTPGCSAVTSTCTGTRQCDYNWKEVAP